MIDYTKITVVGGKGGNGAGSFRRVKGKRRGKADGGDGGTGGNVFVEATLDLNTLEPFRFVKNYKAKDGQIGFSNLRRGANGGDLVLKVPVGTQVKVESQSGKSTEKLFTSHFDYDLVSGGERVLVARGGGGGRGNVKLRDEFGRRPKAGEKGAVGDVCDITLELKLIADVGLIGLPNAGKSTLLSVLTSAKPQIASYPFTTLEPNLGVLDSSQFTVHSSQKSQKKISESVDREPITVNKPAALVLADIPGLIEGASKGRGLGDLFLKHIERTKILVHLIDASASADHWQDYQTIRQELKTFSKDLVKKREIVVLTKTDLADPSEILQMRKLFSQKRKKVLAVSALQKKGLEELVREIVSRV